MKLDGTVRNYAWGDREALATIQGRSPSREPEAELWLGAHPSGSAMVGDVPLVDIVADNPETVLGPEVAARYGQLPYLLKILAAAEPLSIQVHPNLAQASAGFERENREGVPLDSPGRTYRDANHKPELICAITPFEAKCGFRHPDATLELLAVLDDKMPASNDSDVVDTWQKLVEALSQSGSDHGRRSSDRLGQAIKFLLGLDADVEQRFVSAVVAAAEAVVASDSPSSRWRSELNWTVELNRFHPGDIGIVMALLLNHVVLEPGDALFLDAGNLHSYLRGTGVEIMANSDNVVRGGLTVKNIDAAELLNIVDPTPIEVPIQRPPVEASSHQYDTPAPEFALTRLVLKSGESVDIEAKGPEIILVTEGEARLCREDDEIEGSTVIGGGEAVFLTASSTSCRIEAASPVVAWRAAVGEIV